MLDVFEFFGDIIGSALGLVGCIFGMLIVFACLGLCCFVVVLPEFIF